MLIFSLCFCCWALCPHLLLHLLLVGYGSTQTSTSDGLSGGSSGGSGSLGGGSGESGLAESEHDREGSQKSGMRIVSENF